MPSDEEIDQRSHRAWELGVKYAREHPYKDGHRVYINAAGNICEANDSEDLYQEALKLGVCQYFDVFKYGCQSVWRERGDIK